MNIITVVNIVMTEKSLLQDIEGEFICTIALEVVLLKLITSHLPMMPSIGWLAWLGLELSSNQLKFRLAFKLSPK